LRSNEGRGNGALTSVEVHKGKGCKFDQIITSEQQVSLRLRNYSIPTSVSGKNCGNSRTWNLKDDRSTACSAVDRHTNIETSSPQSDFTSRFRPLSSSRVMLHLRSSRAAIRSIPRLSRCYASSNVPANPAPPGTMGDPKPESSVDKQHPPLGRGYRSQGTSVYRTIRNIWKAGFWRAFWQLKEMNDTKVFAFSFES